MFKFALGQKVRVVAEDIEGEVVGRCEYFGGEGHNTYTVLHEGKDHRQWNEEAIASTELAVTKTEDIEGVGYAPDPRELKQL